MPHKRSKYNKSSQIEQKVITVKDNRALSVKLLHLGNISFHPSIESARIFASGRLRGSYRIQYIDRCGQSREIRGNANPNLVHARVFHNLKGEGQIKLDKSLTISREDCGLPIELEPIRKESLVSVKAYSRHEERLADRIQAHIKSVERSKSWELAARKDRVNLESWVPPVPIVESIQLALGRFTVAGPCSAVTNWLLPNSHFVF
jgi:hypothetical protein